VLGQHQQNDKKIIEVCITALGGTNLGLTDGKPGGIIIKTCRGAKLSR